MDTDRTLRACENRKSPRRLLTIYQIIPQCGFESAPLDLGTYALVKCIRDELGCGVSDVTFAVHDLKYGSSLPYFITRVRILT